MKRFYLRAYAGEAEAGGVPVLLDGAALRSPAKKRLLLPDRAVAEAVAREWDMAGDRINPAAMPLTRLCNSVADGITDGDPAIIAGIARAVAGDALLYLAGEPEGLAQREEEILIPLVRMAGEWLGLALNTGHGTGFVPQPEGLADAIALRLAGVSAFRLGAMHSIADIARSGIIALLLHAGEITPDAGFTASCVDEDWNMAQWGSDSEALAIRQLRREEWNAACLLLA